MKKLLFLISVCLLSQNFTIASEAVAGGMNNRPPVPYSPLNTQVIPVSTSPVSSTVSPVPKSPSSNYSFNLHPVSSSAPIIHVPVVKEPDEPLVKEVLKKPEIKEKEAKRATPPVPVPSSLEMMKREYAQAESELEKYKVLKIKKDSRPPVIVEDNLSKPEDSTVTRATIKVIQFSDSRVFTPEELQKLAAPLLMQSVTIEDIKKVVDGITRCYILGDYATSKAYLPPQDLSDGVLKIGLFEGTVGKVTVKDNRWTRTSYIEKRVAPKEGDLLKIGKVEEDIIKFNNNNPVKLRVGLNAGEEPGQTDITLNAEDPFPFHFAVMTDNQGRQTIGTQRVGGMLAADSLFGYRDRVSLGGYLGSGNKIGFADYNIPVGKYGTRLGASISAGNIDVVNGPMKDFRIGGMSRVYTAYATHPLIDKQDFNLSAYLAGNIKSSNTEISNFKIYDMSTYSTTQGLTARKDTERGVWYTGHYLSEGIYKGMSFDDTYMKYEGNMTRLHDFGKGIIGQFRVSGQFSPEDSLPWMEQFQVGGLSTVRGYSEGLLLGRSGYFASAEVITPLPFLPKRVGSDRLGYIYPRDMIKGAVFMDNGMVFPYKGGADIDGGDLLMSWGLGLRVNLKKDLAARFYWGYGLKNKYEIDQKMGRFHFELTCAPDIGRLVDSRKPVRKKNKKKEAL